MIETIILHAGTPKTGTTALQVTCEQRRAALSRAGIHYPSTHATVGGPHFQPGGKPKHQWMVSDLCGPTVSSFTDHVAEAIAEAAPDCRTMLLSSEGLFNHWWDFSAEGLTALARLAGRYRVQLWVWFRDPVAFFTSLYIQNLKNPQGPVACYGRDWPPEAMLDDPWLARRLDYAAFTEAADAVLGRGVVHPFRYRGSSVRDAFETLGLRELPHTESRANLALGRIGVDLLRTVNRHPLSPGQKAACVDTITRLDATLPQSGRFELEASTKSDIRSRTDQSMRRLSSAYGIDLTAPPGTDDGPA